MTNGLLAIERVRETAFDQYIANFFESITLSLRLKSFLPNEVLHVGHGNIRIGAVVVFP